MIELNKKTQQDFLNREWVQKLLDAGVDMSDAKYLIIRVKNELGEKDYVMFRNNYVSKFKKDTVAIPTYTVSELLYKLHEWIYPIIDGKEYSGGLYLTKDAPFYMASYNTKDREGNLNLDFFMCTSEYPIESLAQLLILCHKSDIGCGMPDTGDISSK